jgi:hypothetical protein
MTEEPNEWKPISAAEFDSMLQKAWELELERKAIANAKTSWMGTKTMLKALPFEVKF